MIRWQPGYVYPPVFFPPHPAVHPVDALFFALVALAVGAMTFRRPALGLGALILCIPFADARYIGGGATSITVPKAALAGFFVALIAHRPSFGLLRDRRVRVMVGGFAAVFAAIVLSGLHASHPGNVARELGKWIEYATLFAAAAVAFSNDPDDRPIWRALVAITYVEAALALAQLLTGAPSGMLVHDGVVPRVTGSLEGPNQFAGWLNLLAPVLFARLLVHRDPLLAGAFALALVLEAATLSRAGIAAAVIGLGVVLAMTRPSRAVRIRFAVAAVALLAALIAVGTAAGLQARFTSLAEMPQADRLGTRAILWSSALELWRRSPLTGVGAGNYEEDLGTVGHPEVHTHANSLYLQTLAETGVAGLAALAFLLYASLSPFVRSFSRRSLVSGALAANVALALHQVFDYLWFFPKVGALWALLLGIGLVEVIGSRDDIDALPEAL